MPGLSVCALKKSSAAVRYERSANQSTVTSNSLNENYIMRAAYRAALETGARVYLVGGGVRDIVLSRKCAGDLDFAVSGHFDAFVQVLAGILHGRAIPWEQDQRRIAFKTDGVRHHADVARCRNNDIAADLVSRDVTMNAMALDVGPLVRNGTFELIDPCNGLQDISNKTIRFCSPTSFSDDPVRILRCVRFARLTGFLYDPGTRRAMTEAASLITQAPVERIKRELCKICALPETNASWKEMIAFGLDDALLPELGVMKSVAQTSPHFETVLMHSLRTLKALDRLLAGCADVAGRHSASVSDHLDEAIEDDVSRRSLLVLAALLHDSGKAFRSRRNGKSITFYGHEQESGKKGRDAARRLGLGKRAQLIVQLLTQLHMRLLHLSQLEFVSVQAKKRLIRDAGTVLPELMLLSIADARAVHEGGLKNGLGEMEALGFELLNMFFEQSDMKPFTDLLSGDDIKEMLGIPEGPRVGTILGRLHELERNGSIRTRDEAVEWLKKQS